MAENKIPPTERIATSFKQLAVASSDLDVVAKDLGISISNLESSVRRIGVQISAWRQVAGRQDDDGSYWSRDIGWAKINDFWCIAIRKTNGHHEHDYHNEEIWAFSDAPRSMAIESSGKLPDFFETLVKRTLETTDKLKARKQEADELAGAIEAVLPDTVEQVRALKKGKK